MKTLLWLTLSIAPLAISWSPCQLSLALSLTLPLTLSHPPLSLPSSPSLMPPSHIHSLALLPLSWFATAIAFTIVQEESNQHTKSTYQIKLQLEITRKTLNVSDMITNLFRLTGVYCFLIKVCPFSISHHANTYEARYDPYRLDTDKRLVII